MEDKILAALSAKKPRDAYQVFTLIKDTVSGGITMLEVSTKLEELASSGQINVQKQDRRKASPFYTRKE